MREGPWRTTKKIRLSRLVRCGALERELRHPLPSLKS
jgi:hypothetical protein